MTNETENKALATFEGNKVRKVWFNEKWYFSIIDIVGILTESTEPRRYWSDLKRKLTEKSENEELYEKIVRLKMLSSE